MNSRPQPSNPRPSAKCRCGCNGPADFEVKGFEYNPRAPGGKGAPFTGWYCANSADYFAGVSAELHLPCAVTPLSTLLG